jgi:glycosyltransferase involved in cell wall biosynthesis
LNPRWSIIIPTYRRPEALGRCLQSLTELACQPDEFEVIVVNDGGDSLDAVAERFEQKLNLRIINQANGGPGRARNHGAAHATGRFIAFTDDDCAPAPRWLAELDVQMTADPRCVAGGYVVNTLQGFRNLCSAASQSLVSYLYTYYNGSPETARFFTSNNMGVERDLFRSFGGFDTAYHRAAAEDREFCDRWTQADLCAGRDRPPCPSAVAFRVPPAALPIWPRRAALSPVPGRP